MNESTQAVPLEELAKVFGEFYGRSIRSRSPWGFVIDAFPADLFPIIARSPTSVFAALDDFRASQAAADAALTAEEDDDDDDLEEEEDAAPEKRSHDGAGTPEGKRSKPADS